MTEYCHDKFISLSEENIKSDPKLFWSFVKSKNASGGIPAKMIHNGKTLSHGDEICNAFNQYFHCVFVPNQNTSTLPSCSNSESALNICSVDITLTRVLKELEKVNVNKGSSSDNIHQIFIRECSDELAIPLTLIFQASIKTGVFPSK